jgi:hypothetical protein
MSGPLRAGDEVEVRSAEEILATLDPNCSTEGLPFMPEMLAHCGRRLVVSARAERICDTIKYLGSMRLPNTVVLEDVRCDGAGHGGCEAECRVFWKEAWLRRVPRGEAPRTPAPDGGKLAELERRLAASARSGAPGAPDGEIHRCQATELVRASERIRLVDPRPYLRVLASGSVPFGRFVRVMGRAVVLEALRKLGRLPEVHLAGDGTAVGPSAELGLRAGDWVEVRPPEEIRRTLTPQGKNRGLWFDREMLPFCGRTFRVRRRVTRIVDERTGRMLTFKRDCITLDGVVCSGENSLGRWFCPRGIFPYWRESWLRRVEPHGAGSAPPAGET